ncbi:hypothetical protein ABIE78_004138 [Sinorhizobium fredii]
MTSIIVWNWLFLHFLSRIGIGDAGSVDGESERAQFDFRAGDRLVERRTTGHVGGDLDAAAPRAGDEFRRLREPIVGAAIEQSNLRP